MTIYDDEGRQHSQGVHRLVALAFIGPPPDGKPLCCHRDGRSDNNVPENLYWGDHDDNAADAIAHRQMAQNRRNEQMVSDPSVLRKVKMANKIKMVDRLGKRRENHAH